MALSACSVDQTCCHARSVFSAAGPTLELPWSLGFPGWTWWLSTRRLRFRGLTVDDRRAVVAAQQIHKCIAGNRVLDGVTLEVERGEAVAVVGPSGSGKSTLMAVLGLLTGFDSGALTLCGRPVPSSRVARSTLRQSLRLAWLPQVPMLLPGRLVVENVLLASVFSDGLDAIAVDRALDVLHRVDLGYAAWRDASVLSGGEMQRLNVARAVMFGGPLILADEPTSSLDRKNTAGVIEALISGLGNGQSLLVATHDERVAAKCSRVVALEDGRSR